MRGPCCGWEPPMISKRQRRAESSKRRKTGTGCRARVPGRVAGALGAGLMLAGGALWLQACSNVASSEGLRIDLEMIQGHSVEQTEIEPLYSAQLASEDATATESQGYAFTLSQARVVISALELFSCQGQRASAVPAPGSHPDRPWLQQWTDAVWGLPRALAHEDASPLALVVPHVVELLAPAGEAQSLGSIAPPPGEYCGMHVRVAAADEDAVKLGAPDAETSTEDMVGVALDIEGQWRHAADPEAEGTPFRLRGTAEVATTTWFADNATVALNLEQQTGRLQVRLYYERMFVDVDPQQQSEQEQLEKVLRNLLFGVQLVPCTVDAESGC